MPQSIDYLSSMNSRQRRRWPLRLFFGLLAGVPLLASPFVSVRETRNRMDAVTGSMEWQTVWLSHLTSGPTIDVSPLELRMKKVGVSWTRDWRFLSNTPRTIFGTPTCHECGSAPPISQIQPVLKGFVDTSSDDEILTFVRIMQSGTEAQQRAAVDAACEKALRAFERARP
jgi:hypothetical protein